MTDTTYAEGMLHRLKAAIDEMDVDAVEHYIFEVSDALGGDHEAVLEAREFLGWMRDPLEAERPAPEWITGWRDFHEAV